MRDDMGNEVEQLTEEELSRIVAAPVPEVRRLGKDDIKEWKPTYTKILILIQKGLTIRQIARLEDIGFKERQLKNIVRSPLFQTRMAMFANRVDTALLGRAEEELTKAPEIDAARKKLAIMAADAADLLIQVMLPSKSFREKHSIHERRLMASIAQDVLNRAGLQTIHTAEESKPSREYSPDEIKSALANAKELEGIAHRLGQGGSSFILSTEQRTGHGGEETPPDPSLIETTSAESTAVEETVTSPSQPGIQTTEEV